MCGDIISINCYKSSLLNDWLVWYSKVLVIGGFQFKNVFLFVFWYFLYQYCVLCRASKMAPWDPTPLSCSKKNKLGYTRGLYSWVILVGYTRGLYSWVILVGYTRGLYSWGILVGYTRGWFVQCSSGSALADRMSPTRHFQVKYHQHLKCTYLRFRDR